MAKFEQLNNSTDDTEIEKEPEIDQEQMESILESETGIDKPILERIRDNKFLRRVFYSLMLSVGLSFSNEAFSGDKLISAKHNRDGTEVAWDAKELRTIEKNKKFIASDEFIVPQDVINTFARVVDPGMPPGTEPGGGYFKSNFLDTPEKKEAFRKKLSDKGFSTDDIERISGYFEGDRIVFSDRVLAEEDFKDVLAHERLHKAISHLDSDDLKKINEPRDFLINDYKIKSEEWSSEADSIYVELLGNADAMNPQEREGRHEEYNTRKHKLIMSHNPILLDKNDDDSDIDLATVTSRPDEFYTYLMNGRLSPRIEPFIRSNYPDAFKIYNDLRNDIYSKIGIAVENGK